MVTTKPSITTNITNRTFGTLRKNVVLPIFFLGSISFLFSLNMLPYSTNQDLDQTNQDSTPIYPVSAGLDDTDQSIVTAFSTLGNGTLPDVKFGSAMGDFDLAERLKDRRSDFILYNGIPKSGTSSLRASMVSSDVNVVDVSGSGWGCTASVTQHWEAAFISSHTVNSKAASLTFATGHACFPELSSPAVAVQTIREPVSRWRSAYEYSMWGPRSPSAQLRSRTQVINSLQLNDTIQAESVEEWDPRLSFKNCVLNVDCLANVLKTALQERAAFQPCSSCKTPDVRS
jgi:hypothetical protein